MNLSTSDISLLAAVRLQYQLLISVLAPLSVVGAAAGIAFLINRRRERHAQAPSRPLDLTALRAATSQISPETLALISAAIWATWGSGARLVQVRELAEIVRIGESSNDWSREGRREIYASHRLH